jgi:serine phosphatase RsbU (regulator of sigma subunit)/DNA-binding NarL/FixJ family response regulator
MAEKIPIRVIIVDDQAIVRSGLGAFVMAFDELNLVGEASHGEEAIQLCKLVQPDVVLMDLKMPIMDGITATRQIRQLWPNIQVLVLTSFKDQANIQAALDSGAKGYLSKDITAQELVEAIRQVKAGLTLVDQDVVEAVDTSELVDQFRRELHGAELDLKGLAESLFRHLPNLLPDCAIIVRVYPDQDLLVHPSGTAEFVDELAWEWIRQASGPNAYLPGARYPWGGRQGENCGMVLAPLYSDVNNQVVGGVGVVRHDNLGGLTELTGLVESICQQITAVLNKVQNREDMVAKQTVTQELVSAGKIQAGILPESLPKINGWELTAYLEPARETSGDFYDCIPLANGNMGIVIADVTDKGIGAALIMALTSTLIRTYATQYPTLPAFAMSAVNRRILSDTRGNMFVTAFYGVLEPKIGRLRYVNAGHNPPFLISSQKGKPVDKLHGTGMALGVLESAVWNQKIARFAPGDFLLLYTDGITEARNRRGEYFGEDRLLRTIRSRLGNSAQEIREAVLDEVRGFLGDEPRQDDIALMVLTREG